MKWEDPPLRNRIMPSERAFEREAAELKAHPKRWALVTIIPTDRLKSGTGTASAMRRGQYASFRPAGAFEAVSRQVTDENGDEVVKIYARYVGVPSSESSDSSGS